MASTRKDWEDLNITRDEVRNITEALKNDEFRKLLVDYVQETQSAASVKKYQEEVVQLEAGRGIDCTFVNPIPGFVVKTSVDGLKKAFINICANNLIGKPVSKCVNVENSRGLSWSIPYSLAPGRDDYDNKHLLCTVYDAIFHTDTLHLAHNNIQFRNLVIDTAFKGLEENYGIKLDKKNFKLPKLKYKGAPYATVIRKKSSNPPEDLEDNLDFYRKLQINTEESKTTPVQTQKATKSAHIVEDSNYTIPNYHIKYRHDIDLEEFTDDKTCKMQVAIPKELVISINLPLLNSSNNVNLDILEKALELTCDKPAKYKLNLTLPYEVLKDEGSAKFDVDKKVLTITLPVYRRSIHITDLTHDDSGVESCTGDSNGNEVICVDYEPMEVTKEARCDSIKVSAFLDENTHYSFPTYDYNRNNNSISFIINVKNVDPESVKRMKLYNNGFHIKFHSLGSGFFPINYAFCAKFSSKMTDEIIIETWDNNLTVQAQLEELNNEDDIYVGVDENNLVQRCVDNILDLSKKVDEMKLLQEQNNEPNEITVVSADADCVVFDVVMAKSDDESEEVSAFGDVVEGSDWPTTFPKLRTLSEGSGDEMPSSTRRGILKNRMNRSLSESCADDSHFPSGVLFTWSDSCIPEAEDERRDIKKTVRFSKHIQQQVFRANSSILGQRKKNQKRAKNKRRAQERRASESENSEEGDERSKWTKQRDQRRNSQSDTDAQQKSDIKKKSTLKHKNPEFRSNLIHSLDK